MFQRVFGLDHLHSTRCHFGFGTVDVERREGSEFQGAFVPLVAHVGRFERFLFHLQIAPRLDHGPILPHRLQNSVVDLGLKAGPRLLERPARDHDRGAVHKQPTIAQQGLGELQIQAGAGIGIKKIERAVGGKLAAGELNLELGAGLKGLVIGDLSFLSQLVERTVSGYSYALELVGSVIRVTVYGEKCLQLRVKRTQRAEQREFLGLHLGLLDAHRAVILQCEDDGVVQTELQLAIREVVAEMCGTGQLVGCDFGIQQSPVALAALRGRLENRQPYQQETNPNATEFHFIPPDCRAMSDPGNIRSQVSSPVLPNPKDGLASIERK